MANELPCSQKMFRLELADWLPVWYGAHLRRLRHLMERLGQDSALAVWQEVTRGDDDPHLVEILAGGGQEAAPEKAVAVEARIAELPGRYFRAAVEGVPGEGARGLVEQMPPIRQIRQLRPSLNVWRDTTTYEALHLGSDGAARLVEALIRRHGKQGELIAYDMVHEGRIAAWAGQTGSVAEFMTSFTQEPDEPDMFTAGLRQEIVRASDREAVVHVHECEWARYYRERHPQVGYLMACSTDEAACRSYNKDLRLQRTTTLMEGGKSCDFRVYAVEEADAS